MKKTNFNLPGLPNLPSAAKISAPSVPTRNTGVSKTGSFNDGADKAINFGKASRAATKNPPPTSAWSSLLSGASSGGLAGTIGSAVGFGGGISSLFSGLTNLFGGGKTAPPALIAYQLPTTQEQTVSTGSSVSTTGVYGGPSTPAPFEAQSNQIVQSVKQALLNSSSLNDVIAEL